MIRFAFAGLPVSLLLLTSAVASAAHPLITEDTATLGAGRFQLEITNEHATTRAASARQYTVLTNTILSYGATDTTDVLVSLPYLRLGASAADGTPGVNGWADAGLDIKWRFYESGPVSLAVKPGIAFPTGDAKRGLGIGEHSWSAYLVTSYDARPWTGHLHLGHLHHNNTVNERTDIWHASAAVVRQQGEKLKLILDAGVDTNTDRNSDYSPVFVTVGAIWSLRPNFDIDAGFRRAHGGDTTSHTSLAGLTARW